MHERIKLRREQLDLTQEELAQLLGVSHQTVGKWEKPIEKGGSAPKRWRAAQVANRLEVPLDWLLTGKSANFNPEGAIERRYVYLPRYVPKHESGSEHLKYHEALFSYDDEREDTLAVRTAWLEKHGLKPQTLCWWELPDTAMQLADQVVIDTAQTTLIDKEAYLLDGENGVRVRRIVPLRDGQLILRADNPFVPDEVMSPDAAGIVGRIVGQFGAPPL